MTTLKLRKINSQSEISIETGTLYFRDNCEICWISVKENAVVIILKDDFRVFPGKNGDIWIEKREKDLLEC